MNERVPSGAPDQAMWGEREPPCAVALAGIVPPSARVSLVREKEGTPIPS